MAITWAAALGWRLGRQLLDPVGSEPVAGVVRRLGAVPAQHDEAASLAVRARRATSRAGEVERALERGSVIKTIAFRGATQLMVPEDAGNYLALRLASRMWELPSWQEHYGLTPADWPALRETVREALAGGPLTRAQLGAAVTAVPRFRHLGFAFTDGSGTLLKPFAWHGDLSLGPSRDGRWTFRGFDGIPRWRGVPDLEEAGPRAVEAYFRAYGPATADHLGYWLGEALGAPRKRLRAWIDALPLETVPIDGEPALVLADDLAELEKAEPSAAVRLLPGHDQWVLGPGTKDAHVVPPAHRQPVTRGRNLVLLGGVVAGTWAAKGGRVVVDPFPGADPLPADALAAEVARLAPVLGSSPDPVIRTAGDS